MIVYTAFASIEYVLFTEVFGYSPITRLIPFGFHIITGIITVFLGKRKSALLLNSILHIGYNNLVFLLTK